MNIIICYFNILSQFKIDFHTIVINMYFHFRRKQTGRKEVGSILLKYILKGEIIHNPYLFLSDLINIDILAKKFNVTNLNL